MSAFHYAFKVKDIESTRKFYVEIIGCTEGRSSNFWIDFIFFENQLSAHVSTEIKKLDFCGNVDGIKVPIPHFGCLLSVDQFKALQKRLENANIDFVIKPQKRYQGKVGEQCTMFVFDLSGNPLEFKAFVNNEEIFKV